MPVAWVNEISWDDLNQQIAETVETTSRAQDEVQLDVARKYGFATWQQLRVFAHCRDAGVELFPPDDDVARFLHHACLTYSHQDDPSRWTTARSMLQNDPTLATRDIFTASCVGDAEAVARRLDDDPQLVTALGGPFSWQPLMYACYSRLNLTGNSTLEVARLLLERGADANAHFMWGGQYRFTALTGAFGEGEGGPANLPEHESCDKLARLLLDAGADPNDSQALYNRMFTPGSKCLELLLQYGLNNQDRCNWLLYEEGDLVANPIATLSYQLNWALNNHHIERARLLIQHGADAHQVDEDRSWYELARIRGQDDLAALLVERGAEPVELQPVDALAAAIMTGDAATAKAMIQADPELKRQLGEEHDNLLRDAAEANCLAAVQIMADLGVELNPRDEPGPLHEAAWSGQLEMVQLLVASGADVRLRDANYGGTPLGWADSNAQQAVVDYLAGQEVDIFDLIRCEDLPRIAAQLDARPEQIEITIGQLRDAPDNPLELDWKTPLVAAVLLKKPAAVKLLLDRGANAAIADPSGRSLQELAAAESNPEIAALIAGS